MSFKLNHMLIKSQMKDSELKEFMVLLLEVQELQLKAHLEILTEMNRWEGLSYDYQSWDHRRDSWISKLKE